MANKGTAEYNRYIYEKRLVEIHNDYEMTKAETEQWAALFTVFALGGVTLALATGAGPFGNLVYVVVQ